MTDLLDVPASAAVRSALAIATSVANDRPDQPLSVRSWDLTAVVDTPAARAAGPRRTISIWVGKFGVTLSVPHANGITSLASWELPYVAMDTDAGLAWFAERLAVRLDLAVGVLRGQVVVS